MYRSHACCWQSAGWPPTVIQHTSRRTCAQQMPCVSWAGRMKRCMPIKKGSASAQVTQPRRCISSSNPQSFMHPPLWHVVDCPQAQEHSTLKSAVCHQAGSRLAAADAALQESAQGREASAALQGICKSLPLEGTSEDCAADLLLSAQAMLVACPMAERAKIASVEVRSSTAPRHRWCISDQDLQPRNAHNVLETPINPAACPVMQLSGRRDGEMPAPVQALIMCQRYADARVAASKLLPGVDRLYLEAEASWRAGVLSEALAALRGALTISAGSQKCSERLQTLQPVQQLDASSLAAHGAGESTRMVQAGCRSMRTWRAPRSSY